MIDFWKSVLGFIGANRFFANLAFGLVFATSTTLVSGHFLQFLNITFPPAFSVTMTMGHEQEVCAIFFLLLVATCLAGLYITKIDKEDYLSPIRKKLAGQWLSNFNTYHLEDIHAGKSHDIIFGDISNVCDIYIDQKTRKLSLTIHVLNTDIFKMTKLITSNIHIEDKGAESYLIFYDDFEFSVNDSYINKFERPTIIFPMIGLLKFNSKQSDISYMTGYWYDIENTVFKTLAQVAERAQLTKMRADLDDGRKTMKEEITFQRIVR